jgi:hypothetical protein
MRKIFLLLTIAVSACSTPVQIASNTIDLSLKREVSIAIRREFAYNARLANGEIATQKQPDVPIDPVLPQLAEFRNLQREAPRLGPDGPRESVLLATKYEDAGINYEIHVNVAWTASKHDLKDMNAIVESQPRLDEVAAHHERTMRAQNDNYFSDNIAIHGWKLDGRYPVIDYEYHSKLHDLGNFDTDYIYNRTLTIGREDGTIIVIIDMPESRRATWAARVETMVKSLAFAKD